MLFILKLKLNLEAFNLNMKAIEVQFRKGEFSYIENKIVQEETKVAPPNQQPEKHRRKQSVLTKD